jgi:GABA permease
MIVANQTLGGDQLVQAIRDYMAAGPTEFWIVVPATPVQHLVPTFVPPMPVMGGPLNLPPSPEEGRSLAEAKLQSAVEQLRAAGATADGEVGDPDPMRAVEAALAKRKFDEIIVSTLPERLSHWLHQDLPWRIEHRFHLPVTHVIVTKVSRH